MLSRCFAVLALLVSCSAAQRPPEHVDPLQGLEDCPRAHEVALKSDDVAHMNALIAGAERSSRAERGRCAPAERECVSSCAA